MAAYLVDTNVLLRAIYRGSAEHLLCLQSLVTLRNQGHVPYVTPQNLVELWSVATRPAHANGLGQRPQDVEVEVSRILTDFPLFEDDPTIFLRWGRLVSRYAVSGRQVHDARLVAVMHTYGVPYLLTLNGADFSRYPQVTTVHPADVLSP